MRQVLLRGMAITVLYVVAVWLVLVIQVFNWGRASVTWQPPFPAMRADVVDRLNLREQGDWVRQQCHDYIVAHAAVDLGEYRCSDYEQTTGKEWFHSPEFERTYLNSTWVQINIKKVVSRSDEHTPFRDFLRYFTWINLASIACGILAKSVRLPLLEFIGTLVGPLWATYFVASVARWRVFGPITKQYFFPSWNLLVYDDDLCRIICTILLVAVIVTLPFYEYLHRNIHLIYSTFMRKAYYANGKDTPLASMAINPYCPYLILGAVISEYARPTDVFNYGDCMLTQLFMGGERTGCWQVPEWFSMSRAMGISGAAIDALVTVVDQVRTRWWIGMFNLQMGDWVCMSRWDERWFLFRAGLRCNGRRLLQQILMSAPSILVLCAVYLLFVLGVVFDVQHQAGTCFSRTIMDISVYVIEFLAAASLFVFLPCMAWLHRSPMVRHLLMMVQHHFRSDKVPEYFYLSDGGLFECLGLLALLRRRSRWMLVGDATAVWDDPCHCLRQSIDLALSEGLCSFFDPNNHRRDIRYAMQEFASNSSMAVLHLGVEYEGSDRQVGDIFFFRMRIPEDDAEPLQPTLTPADFRRSGRPRASSNGTDRASQMTEMEMSQVSTSLARETSARSSGHSASKRLSYNFVEEPQRRDLTGACCFNCCHSLGMPCGRRFPEIATANQCFTPLLFANMCRLGHELCGKALTHVQDTMNSAGE